MTYIFALISVFLLLILFVYRKYHVWERDVIENDNRELRQKLQILVEELHRLTGPRPVVPVYIPSPGTSTPAKEKK